MIDELAVAAAKGKGNDKIAAVRVKYEAERYLFDLQRELLLVPKNLGTMTEERDIRELGKLLIAWAERFVPEETQADVFMELAELIESGGRGDVVLEAGEEG